jgi:hypothetical protein
VIVSARATAAIVSQMAAANTAIPIFLNVMCPPVAGSGCI